MNINSTVNTVVDIDQVLDRSDNTIITCKKIHPDEDYLRGHYPDFAIFPGVFAVDCAIQTCFVFLGEDTSYQLKEVSSVRFSGPALPGDTLECRGEFKEKQGGQILVATIACATEKNKVVKVKITFENAKGS